jgi:putative endonuclease
MKAGPYFVYILRNVAGGFYVGQTQDPAARLASHNETGASEGKYTRKNGPWVWVHQEVFGTRAEAMRREREIKAWKSAERIRVLVLGGQSPVKRD